MSELKIGLWFFLSVHCLIISYIYTKFHEESFNSLEVIEQTQPDFMKYTKGHNHVRTESRLWFFFSAYFLIMP